MYVDRKYLSEAVSAVMHIGCAGAGDYPLLHASEQAVLRCGALGTGDVADPPAPATADDPAAAGVVPPALSRGASSSAGAGAGGGGLGVQGQQLQESAGRRSEGAAAEAARPVEAPPPGWVRMRPMVEVHAEATHVRPTDLETAMLSGWAEWVRTTPRSIERLHMTAVHSRRHS